MRVPGEAVEEQEWRTVLTPPVEQTQPEATAEKIANLSVGDIVLIPGFDGPRTIRGAAKVTDGADTGKPDPPGVYAMNDDVHAELVEELAKTNFKEMSPALRAELTQFYADPNAPYATRRKPKEWAKLQVALQLLKSAPAAPVEAQTLPAYGGIPSAPAE